VISACAESGRVAPPRLEAVKRVSLPIVPQNTPRIESEPPVASEPPAASEHWYFESLSADSKRALLRELDPLARSTFHVRVVDVENGKTLDEATLPELAKIPASTIGGKPTELAALEWMLASPAFGRDVVKGATIASAFPFGECGRVAAATNRAAIAFDAGDWLYVADEAGRVRRRLVEEAAYDPRFSPDGKYLFFRRATGSVDVFAKYELFVVPADLSAPPRALPNTAGMHDRFVLHPDGQSAFAITSPSRAERAAARGAADTCVVSLSMRPPFPVKRLACLDGNEQLVEAVVSPKGKWAALSTKKRSDGASDARRLEWRLRVVSLTTGKVVRDEPDTPGLGVRAISDSGLLVQSGALGVIVHDVPAKKWRELARPIDLGHRGFFRNDKELVYVADGSVGLVDVSKD
jgi:hypothetical protein